MNQSSKDLLIASFTLDDGARLMLSVEMIGQFRRARRHGTGQQQLFQIVKERRIVFGAEGYGSAVLARTSRTTDTMRVVFDGLGHVVIDDQRHVLDVDTTSGHVGGHQDVLGSRFQVRERKFTLLLALTTVQCTSIELKSIKENVSLVNWND